jgi:hypothetical protein
MRYANSLSMAVVALALAGPVGVALGQDSASGGKWQSVAKTDNQEAFVATASIAIVDSQLEARVKQNYVQAQPAAKKDKSYLSTRSLYRFDCAQRKIGMKELRAYSGADLQGEVVQKATSKDQNMQWLPAEERTVFGELLDYVCKAAPAG